MKSVVAAIILLVCVALVHSSPLSKGQSNTNINKNTNTNGNYEALYNFLSGLLDPEEEEEEEEPIIETPVYKPPVYKPTKPYPVYPGGGDYVEDKYPVVTSKPPTTNYGYAPYRPSTVSIHKPCKHCPAKPTPYKPYKIPYSSGSHATEEDDSEFDFKKAAGAKQAPAAETETTN
ncbi:hypothetical protein DAPPUDRAFT_308165 [Daphnia pulex]|uniref:Uncharacterized protein n=1 Tax=Daphnia pulex TaxID=6669 RepID=E9H6M8_DAPPU|nr:hypothetical protein DAPPUDRAFT_308165 [Daphnia pulex]|eukprot:EFX72537.1 hypothetical protein DAPPUDRAFT_308165 [Daphnia pulex]